MERVWSKKIRVSTDNYALRLGRGSLPRFLSSPSFGSRGLLQVIGSARPFLSLLFSIAILGVLKFLTELWISGCVPSTRFLCFTVFIAHCEAFCRLYYLLLSFPRFLFALRISSVSSGSRGASHAVGGLFGFSSLISDRSH